MYFIDEGFIISFEHDQSNLCLVANLLCGREPVVDTRLRKDGLLRIVKSYRLLIVRLIHFLHWAVIIFVVFGWLIPLESTRWMHIFTIPTLVIHWQTNKGRCVLTQIEDRLKRPEDLSAAEEEESFIKKAFRKYLGIKLNERSLKFLIYTAMGLAWSASILQII